MSGPGPVTDEVALKVFEALRAASEEALKTGVSRKAEDVIEASSEEGKALMQSVMFMSKVTSDVMPGKCRHTILAGIAYLAQSLIGSQIVRQTMGLGAGAGPSFSLGLLMGCLLSANYIGHTLNLFDTFDRAGERGETQH